MSTVLVLPRVTPEAACRQLLTLDGAGWSLVGHLAGCCLVDLVLPRVVSPAGQLRLI